MVLYIQEKISDMITFSDGDAHKMVMNQFSLAHIPNGTYKFVCNDKTIEQQKFNTPFKVTNNTLVTKFGIDDIGGRYGGRIDFNGVRYYLAAGPIPPAVYQPSEALLTSLLGIKRIGD